MLNYLRKKLLFEEHICPWWLAYTFDHRIRNLFHNPNKILGAYIQPGMTVLDIGCGMGFFSIGLAKLVGENGKVYAIDIQEKMLEILKKRAEKIGFSSLIHTKLSSQSEILMTDKADFGLSFWMIHEVPDKLSFIKQVIHLLNQKGKYLIVEPKFHTNAKQYNEIMNICNHVGFHKIENPKIFLSWATLFQK